MLKLLFTGMLIYFIYKYFIAPPAIDEERPFGSEKKQDAPQANDNSYDDEYIDYEEID